MRRIEDPIALLGQQVARVRGRAGLAVAVQHDDGDVLGARAVLRVQLAPECGRSGLLRCLYVRTQELLHRRVDVRLVGVQLVRPRQTTDLHLEEVPRGKPVGEEGVRDQLPTRDLALLLPDLNVVPHHLEDLGDGLRVGPAVVDGLLHGLHEQLLAGEAIEVGVGVPVAHVIERLPADELLVTGPEVDRRVDAAVGVVVAAVDVHPDAAELVDDLTEALEVDRDQVVDRQAGERADGLERARRAAVGVRLVDAADVAAPVRAASVDDEVAREREQRKRVQVRG